MTNEKETIYKKIIKEAIDINVHIELTKPKKIRKLTSIVENLYIDIEEKEVSENEVYKN